MDGISTETTGFDDRDREVLARDHRATRGGSQAAGCLVAAIVVFVPALLYFGFFILLILDDLAFRTHYASDNLSPETIDVLRVIYMPLIYVVNAVMSA